MQVRSAAMNIFFILSVAFVCEKASFRLNYTAPFVPGCVSALCSAYAVRYARFANCRTEWSHIPFRHGQQLVMAELNAAEADEYAVRFGALPYGGVGERLKPQPIEIGLHIEQQAAA